MATVNNLPEGKVLTVTAGSGISGMVRFLDAPTDVVSIGENVSQTFGPFESARQFEITNLAGNLNATIGSEPTTYSGELKFHPNPTSIPATASLIIPSATQAVVYDGLTVSGTLDVDGSLILN